MAHFYRECATWFFRDANFLCCVFVFFKKWMDEWEKNIYNTVNTVKSRMRNEKICACLGEAAGTAIALAVETHADTHSIDVKDLRERLIRKGAAV